MSSTIARMVVESFRQKGRGAADVVRLSAREEEVLMWLARGFSNKEIADHLNVSTETVRSHLKHIYEKLHVRSRAEAVARYMTARMPRGGS
jgi:DNA-binding CsgD family transcriptional regulator